jgi:hypothetical protein
VWDRNWTWNAVTLPNLANKGNQRAYRTGHDEHGQSQGGDIVILAAVTAIGRAVLGAFRVMFCERRFIATAPRAGFLARGSSGRQNRLVRRDVRPDWRPPGAKPDYNQSATCQSDTKTRQPSTKSALKPRMKIRSSIFADRLLSA